MFCGHIVIPGNTNQSEVWQEVEKAITKDYFKKDGSIIKVGASCFDSGGHAVLQVYEFALKMTQKGYRVFAIKGRPGTGPVFEYRSRSSKTHKAHRFYFVSTDTTKDTLFSRLKLQAPGENYIHFAKTLQMPYYDQLTCEAPKWELVRGRPRKGWVQKPGTRREAPDCWRYGFSALFSDNQTAYKIACNDYEARLRNEVKDETPKVYKSSYLERFRY